MNFLAYEAVPFELQRKLIDDYSKQLKKNWYKAGTRYETRSKSEVRERVRASCLVVALVY